MDLFVEITKTTALVLLEVINVALVLSAILSWIPMEENFFTDILARLTEPMIFPFRWLLHKLNWFQGFPIDMAFLLTVIVISALRSLLLML